MFPIELLGVKTNPAKSARNLGVIFDENFTFRSHISVACNSCCYHMATIDLTSEVEDNDTEKMILCDFSLVCCTNDATILDHFCAGTRLVKLVKSGILVNKLQYGHYLCTSLIIYYLVLADEMYGRSSV